MPPYIASTDILIWTSTSDSCSEPSNICNVWQIALALPWVNILVRRSRSSGDLETACPELGTALDNLYSLSNLLRPYTSRI
ncbi:MAG: hypothetical protein ABFD18_19550, partial [Syntrophomonas sp.]